MTGTTLNSTVLGKSFDKNPVAPAVADTQKTTGKKQDFGDVLGKTAQKLVQTDKTTSVESTKTQQPDNKTVSESKKAGQDNTAPAKETDTAAAKETDTSVDKAAKVIQDTSGEKETAETTVAETEDVSEVTEEPVDEMTADEIARALEQIIEQIKQILGITDEELLCGMEKAGMQPFDLLNPDNMAQLVTAVSGEDSVISLVADEKLYTAVQDITNMVDTQASDLLDKTGLTSEELDIVLEKLQELENDNQTGEVITVDNQDGYDIEQADAGQINSELESSEQVNSELESSEQVNSELESSEQVNSELENSAQLQEIPIIIKEDKAQPARQYDKLPENQQENPVETGMDTNNRTRGTERGAKDDDSKNSKNFGQNNSSQNFNNNVNEVANTTAEGVAKFTSESTENIMRQLADMVKIVKNENLTEMELQLHPASLGTVNVSLTTKGGVVTAQFTTQNEAVKAAIEAQASQLQANLEEQGVKVEAVEVSVASHEMERNLDKDGKEQQQSEEQQRTQRIQGARRRSINLRALEEGSELEEEMLEDDAARIAMEIMTANGNSMDLLA